jgi:predicted nucleotidyltransferase component of viral defense system
MITKANLIAQFQKAVTEERIKTGRELLKEEQLFMLREIIQFNILKELYAGSAAFKNVFFMWGTNLRFCYGLARYSEDMDFTILNKGSVPHKEELTEIMNTFIEWSNKEVIQWRMNFNILKTNIVFPWLPYECWIKNTSVSEKLDIKLELDTHPADWAKFEETTIFFQDSPLRIKHHTIETTFAWKLSAILMRQYAKWRDYYDIDWYLRRKPSVPFSLEYINGNIRRYNEMNKINNDFTPIKEFKDHKEVLEAVWNRILHLNQSEKTRIEWDIKRFVFWENDQLKHYIDSFYDRIMTWLTNYHNSIEFQINKKEINKNMQYFKL